MRHNRANGFVIQVRLRSAESVSLNQLFLRCYGAVGSAIDIWVWYRRIGGGRCVAAPCIKNEYFKLTKKEKKKKRNWCSALKKLLIIEKNERNWRSALKKF